jgi:hypothetical protein
MCAHACGEGDLIEAGVDERSNERVLVEELALHSDLLNVAEAPELRLSLANQQVPGSLVDDNRRCVARLRELMRRGLDLHELRLIRGVPEHEARAVVEGEQDILLLLVCKVRHALLVPFKAPGGGEIRVVSGSHRKMVRYHVTAVIMLTPFLL